MKIKQIKGMEVLDSRGNPTVEVEITVTHANKNITARGIAPSGASTGKYEAYELRDKDTKRYHGKGVLKAVSKVNKNVSRAFKNKSFTQNSFDRKLIRMAGVQKARLGSNTTTAASLAFLNASAKANHKWVYEYLGGKVLPVPFMNIINGGAHAGNDLAIQEFMIVPYGAKTFAQAVQWCSEIYHTLGNNLRKSFTKSAVNVGDEGGFAPPMTHSTQALASIDWAIEECGYKNKVGIAIDAAASEFYDRNYNIDKGSLTTSELVEYYEKLVSEFDIVSIEDPFHEDDYYMFSELNKILMSVQIVADDLTVTNIKRIKKAVQVNAMNTLLLKINQIGTVTEAYEAFKYCLSKNVPTMVSHRSGETEDTTIADICVGLETGQIKTGAPVRGERTAKYNQLMRIEARLGKNAKYAGINFMKFGRKANVLEK